MDRSEPVPDKPDPQDEQEPSISVEDLRALRAKAKEADKAVGELAALNRRVAFAEAGLPQEPWRAYFDKGYEGDLTADAIKAAATEAGFLQAPAPPAQTTPEERATHDRMGQASAGATAAPPVDVRAEIGQAQSAEEVMAILQRNQVPTTWDRQ
jgi:hypothetical protein